MPCITTVQAQVDQAGVRFIEGLSGRRITLGKWANPSGNFKLGLKHSLDLYPKLLVDRLKADVKEKFDIEHHKLLTRVDLDAKASNEDKKDVDEESLLKQEHSLRSQLLRDMIKTYQDPGVMMDCVVFHDGTKWRAAVDFTASGDLTDAILLTNFHDERQYVTISQEAMLNVSVNIYDNGELLSLVANAGLI